MTSVKISKITWGKIIVNGIEYNQILIIGSKIEEREYDRLKSLFGTSHKIGDWEIKKLFSGSPEIILIGTGWDGVLEVPDEIIKQAKKLNKKLEILKSEEAIRKYNELVKDGERVNALIHTTC